MKLSIIIPAYKAEPYIYELFDCLGPQITEDVEVMVIDDGSPKPVEATYPWIKLYRQENKGVSPARNYGIEHTTGEYIAFIDADDLVAPYYVEKLLEKIEEGFDYVEFSWKSLPGDTEQYDCKLNGPDDKMENPSACTRAFKRSFIGDTRFFEKKISSEDENFTRRLNLKSGKRSFITDYMYFYRTGNPNSKSHRFWRGELESRQIVYHYRHVTDDMTWLIDEIKKEDEQNCVWLLTEQNDIPELEKYCRVRRPMPIRGMELRGEPTDLFIQVEMPIKTQVVIWARELPLVSGLSSFVYNFCAVMRKHYEILVLYDSGSPLQVERLRKIVRVKKTKKVIMCDTLIVNSVLGGLPENVTYKKVIQMCHTCMSDKYTIPEADEIIFTSQAAAGRFGGKGKVINNLLERSDCKPALTLISATRLSSEKGWDRMVALGKTFREKKIPFVWYIFTDEDIKMPMAEMVKISPRLDIYPFIKAADYLVQLSDQEAFCYSIVEALTLGTPVITTPMDVLEELGVIDGVNGYVVPYDMKGVQAANIDIYRLKGTFNYTYDNGKRIKKWKDAIGRDLVEVSKYDPERKTMVKVLRPYDDIELKQRQQAGAKLFMPLRRADTVEAAGCCTILEEQG